MARGSDRTRTTAKKNQEAWAPFMVEKKCRLPAQHLSYRYNERRQVNVTVQGGCTRPVILIPSSLATLKTVQKQTRGED